MILCGLFLSTHLSSTSNDSSHSVKTICLKTQRGKKGTGPSFLLIYMRIFLLCLKWDPSLISSHHWTLNLGRPVCKMPRYGLHRQKESMGNTCRGWSCICVWLLGQVHSPKKSSWGLVVGWEISDNLHTHNWEVKEDPTTTKCRRCQSYCVTFRVFYLISQLISDLKAMSAGKG